MNLFKFNGIGLHAVVKLTNSHVLTCLFDLLKKKKKQIKQTSYNMLIRILSYEKYFYENDCNLRK